MTNFRKAKENDLDSIYLMGEDVWGEGLPTHQYLDSCRSSKKYARGQWYILENENGVLLSSLITYALAPQIMGMGSIATHLNLRKQGYASQLILQVIDSFKLTDESIHWFLYADISPQFYEKFGFQALPAKYQNHGESVCMIKSQCVDALLLNPEFAPPSYF